LTLEDIKAQLRIEQDYHFEDDLLKRYGSSAENTLLNYINRSYDEVIEAYGCIPDDLVHATLMLVDSSYQHRSPSSPQQMYYVLYGFDAIVKPYVRLTSDADTQMIQKVPLGSDAKIAFSATLPDDLLMRDVDFSVDVYNADEKDKSVDFDKNECIYLDANEYMVLVDTDDLGVGTCMLKVTFRIPDLDFQAGYRKEVIRINPHVEVTG